MEKHPVTYYKECLENNTAVDILMTGTGVSEDAAASSFPNGYEPHDNTYWECVKNGWLEPLDDYLSNGEGKELKESLAVPLTDSLTDSNGHIYGLGNGFVWAPVLIFNKDTANKYGFDISSFDGKLSTLESTLKKMKENGISGLACGDWGADFVFEEYLGFSAIPSGIYVNENTGKAENLFESSEFRDLAELMKKYHSEGYTFDAARSEIALNDVLCRIETIGTEITPDEVQMPLGNNYYFNSYRNSVFGITAASEHKDEAFELLRLLYSDTELATLFSCGEEGKDYTVEEGRIVIGFDARVPFRGLHFDDAPVNKDILPPIAFRWSKDAPDEIKGESADKAEILDEAEKSCKRSVMYNVTLPDELTERLKPIAKIYADNYKLFLGSTNEDVGKALEQANEKLKAAGIDELLNEVNGYITERSL